MEGKIPQTYEQAGVDYGSLDPFKIAAQRAAGETAMHLHRHGYGYGEVAESRGESAYVWDEGNRYGAMVVEGLGTKNLVADAMREITGKTYYEAIGQDTAAMIINDLLTVGAKPKVIGAHFSVADAAWFNDKERSNDLVRGFRDACHAAQVTWGGGETPALKGILRPGVVELSGSAVGEIKPKERLTLGDKLHAGDSIILLGGTGIHANGLSMARDIAEKLPYGYATRLSDGSMYGEALLAPTPMYAKAVEAVFGAGVDIHYMANITGHGWRKLMRAERELGYLIEDVPQPQPVFDFIQEQAGASREEMYGNFNMGAGYAMFVPARQTYMTLEALLDAGYPAMRAGQVINDPKQVIIRPEQLIFEADSLALR
jgi:phosphoribosylformylglycinamidine cyclo-ligase